MGSGAQLGVAGWLLAAPARDMCINLVRHITLTYYASRGARVPCEGVCGAMYSELVYNIQTHILRALKYYVSGAQGLRMHILH